MTNQEQIEAILLHGQSRNTIDEAVKWVGKDPERFEVLVKLISKHPEKAVKSRSAWALSYLAETNEEWLTPYWKDFVNLLVDPGTPHPVKRNLLRFMQEVKIPEKHHAAVINRSIEILNDPNEDIAIRAFAITVVFNLVKVYPEMAMELKLSIELILPYASPGLKNRAEKTLMQLGKIISPG